MVSEELFAMMRDTLDTAPVVCTVAVAVSPAVVNLLVTYVMAIQYVPVRPPPVVVDSVNVEGIPIDGAV